MPRLEWRQWPQSQNPQRCSRHLHESWTLVTVVRVCALVNEQVHTLKRAWAGSCVHSPDNPTGHRQVGQGKAQSNVLDDLIHEIIYFGKTVQESKHIGSGAASVQLPKKPLSARARGWASPPVPPIASLFNLSSMVQVQAYWTSLFLQVMFQSAQPLSWYWMVFWKLFCTCKPCSHYLHVLHLYGTEPTGAGLSNKGSGSKPRLKTTTSSVMMTKPRAPSCPLFFPRSIPAVVEV